MHTTHPPPSFRELFGELVPLIGVVVCAGPPVVLFAAFGLLLMLLVSAPLMLLAIFLVVPLVAVATLVALVGAILSAPSLVVSRLRARRAPSASIREPARRLVPRAGA
jgi:hypothetical protein